MELNTLASDASLTLLGSTGSIGESTLAVARKIENLSIFALTANTNAARLLAQCLEFNPRYAVLVDSAGADQLAKALRAAGCNTELLVGPEALDQVAADAEVDMGDRHEVAEAHGQALGLDGSYDFIDMNPLHIPNIHRYGLAGGLPAKPVPLDVLVAVIAVVVFLVRRLTFDHAAMPGLELIAADVAARKARR